MATRNTISGNVYIISNVIYKNLAGKYIVAVDNNGGVEHIVLNTEDTTVEDYRIEWRATEDINRNYPYLVYIITVKVDDRDVEQDVYTLTIQPTNIVVNVDENYFDEDAEDIALENRFEKYEQGLYIQYVDKATTDAEEDRPVATAIVYYNQNGNNTHNLVTDDKNTEKTSDDVIGLIEKTIVPSIATGTYSVSIVSGVQIAMLTDADKTITFSGTGKVELKFVSIFDNE